MDGILGAPRGPVNAARVAEGDEIVSVHVKYLLLLVSGFLERPVVGLLTQGREPDARRKRGNCQDQLKKTAQPAPRAFHQIR